MTRFPLRLVGTPGALLLCSLVVTVSVVGTVAAASAAHTTAGGPERAAVGADGGIAQVGTSEIQPGGTYKRGEVLTISSGLSPNEQVRITSTDSGSILLTYSADANGVVTIDTAAAFGDLTVPADLRATDQDGDVDRTFTVVSGEIETAFDPRTARAGSGAQFVIREVVGGDEIRIRSDQLSEAELAEFLQHDPVFELPANGQEIIEFEVPDGDWAPPGEYEFQVENRATGRTATAVFQIREPETPTPTPVPDGTDGFGVQVEPVEVEYGDEVQVQIHGGTPNARAVLVVGDLGPEQTIELFPDADIEYNGSADGPTVPLDADGQWTGIMAVPESFFEDYSEVPVGAVDLGTNREAGAQIEIVGGDATNTSRSDDEETTASDGDTFVPTGDDGATEPDTPARGFFINGADGPLSPVANMLNLTMIGFLLSVVGILYQLMEGR
jgi:hypothetical protein